MPGGSAAITLPARRVGGVAADEPGVARAEREVVDLPVRQELRHPAGGVERVGAVIAEERLAVGRHEQDVTVRREAAHHDVGPQPRHPPRRAARGRHQVDLGMLLVAADERERLAVARKRGCRGFRKPRRQPPRDAAGRAHLPQVVVADENDRVLVEGRVPQITSVAHEFLVATSTKGAIVDEKMSHLADNATAMPIISEAVAV